MKIIRKAKPKPKQTGLLLVGHNRVVRVTRAMLDGSYGRYKYKPVVIEQAKGDLLVLRPKGCRQRETIMVLDVYAYALRKRINAEHREKLAQKKAKRFTAK